MNTTSFFSKFSKTLLLGFTVFTLIFSGCVDEGVESTSGTGEGDLVISLTDAEGDFTTYTVDVTSITLTKQNGAEVSTLPLSTTVDFAQYTEMTEFLTAGTVPSGVYTKATMTLDYSDADIRVENGDGDAVQVDTIIDEDGNTITTLTVSVHLANSNSLLIAPGLPAHLTLDFDLNASNTVVFDGQGVPEMTVMPVLLAQVDAESSKIHRMRGPLMEVDIESSTFEVILRPFYHSIRQRDDRFGTLHVTTGEDTVYDINGDQYQGDEGLPALDEAGMFTAVVVIGDLKFNPYRFEAMEVRAGSSVPGGTLDVVRGNVICRNDSTISLKGATLIRSDGSIIFNDTVSIKLDEDTTVTKQLSTSSFTIDDISVGQRMTAFGDLTTSGMGELELDATGESNGYIRMLLTTIRGAVVDTGSGLTIDLQSVDNRSVGVFDFTGTGISETYDADPENYEIDTGTLDISAISMGTPIKARGFVNGFGQAPSDFIAQTLINVSDVSLNMHVNWIPPTDNPFESLSAQEIVLNLDQSGPLHHVGKRGLRIDLLDLLASPLIRPRTGDQGNFMIQWQGSAQFYTSFESFVADIENHLGSGKNVQSFFARGSFDQDTATMVADCIKIKLTS